VPSAPIGSSPEAPQVLGASPPDLAPKFLFSSAWPPSQKYDPHTEFRGIQGRGVDPLPIGTKIDPPTAPSGFWGVQSFRLGLTPLPRTFYLFFPQFLQDCQGLCPREIWCEYLDALLAKLCKKGFEKFSSYSRWGCKLILRIEVTGSYSCHILEWFWPYPEVIPIRGSEVIVKANFRLVFAGWPFRGTGRGRKWR